MDLEEKEIIVKVRDRGVDVITHGAWSTTTEIIGTLHVAIQTIYEYAKGEGKTNGSE